MDIEVITTLLNNTAFPVVAFVLMYHFATTTIKENTAAMYELINLIKKQRGFD